MKGNATVVGEGDEKMGEAQLIKKSRGGS